MPKNEEDARSPSSPAQEEPSSDVVPLLDEEDAISEQLEACLKHIFAKYCTPRPIASATGAGPALLSPPEGAFLSPEGLDSWARDTNGEPFTEETKEELLEFMDVTDDGALTFKGFMQVYQLQTENDAEETWKDLAAHGFDRSLRLTVDPPL